MPERRNIQDPDKRKRASVNRGSSAPSQRGTAGSPAPSKGPQANANAATPRSGKPSKSSRLSRIPKTTTTSKMSKNPAAKTGSVGKVNRRANPSAAQQPRQSSSLQTPATRKSVASNQQSHPARKATGGNDARRVQAVPRQNNSYKQDRQAVAKPEKSGPQQRTSSASNDFARFTREHPKIMIPIFAIVAVLLLYCVVDLGASFGKIHPGVSVQGVDVGGLSVEEASTKLTDELTPLLTSAHVTIYESDDVAAKDGFAIPEPGIEKAYADENAGADINNDGSIDKWNITAETVGAYIDGPSLAEQAYLVGREGNFVAQRFFSWFGGTHLEAVPAVHVERFNSLMSEINSQIGLNIVDSLIAIENGKVSVKDGSDGWSVDTQSFIERFGQAAFNQEQPYYVIPMKTDPMNIKPATAQQVADQVQKAIGEDVTIVHTPDTWTMDSADLGELISQQVLAPGEVIVFGNGTQKVVADSDEAGYERGIAVDPDSGYALQAYLDQEEFDAWLVATLGDLATGGAVDAWFDTSSGDVVLVEAVEGYGPNRSSAELALQILLFGTPDAETARNRTITLEDGVIEPEFTTAKAQAMGITERLATWSIPLNGTAERIHNLKLLCSMIDHSLVAPGETWSFNGTTGERTEEKGFQTAPVIINGKHEDQLGGGICQVATCVFNCACFSGLGIAERVNHDFYISMYDDDGFNDATVSWRSPDLKWVNDMNTYILLTAVVTDEDVVVSFWGTKDGRTVECQRGEWRDGDKYVQITEVDPELPVGYSKVTQQGIDGRSIDIRYLCTAADGSVLHDVLFHSIYSAQNEITTVGGAGAAPAQPSAEPEAPETPEAKPSAPTPSVAATDQASEAPAQ